MTTTDSTSKAPAVDRYLFAHEFRVEGKVPTASQIPEAAILADERVRYARSSPATDITHNRYKNGQLANGAWGLAYQDLETDADAEELFRQHPDPEEDGEVRDVSIGKHSYYVRIDVEAASMDWAEHIAREILGNLEKAYPVAAQLEWFASSGVELVEAGTPAASYREKPDFATLYDNTGGESWPLTPRTACMIFQELEGLAWRCRAAAADGDDSAAHFMENFWSGDNGKSFPPAAWQQDAAWLARFADAAYGLAGDFAEGWPEPASTAEEMALHLAIDMAEELIGQGFDSEFDPDPDREQRWPIWAASHYVLPDRPNDYNWEACRESLFEDEDVLWLFDPKMEDFALGCKGLNPSGWFNWFRPPGRKPQPGENLT